MSRWCAGSDLEGDNPPLELPVDESRIGEVRRAAQAAAVRVGLDEAQVARVALVATELATNAARHGGGGTVVVRTMTATPGIEILSLDAGPGVSDIERALRDGYSTGGSSGTGLGAIRRLADAFDIWSQAGKGTVVVARMLAARSGPPAQRPPEIGVVCLPAPDERLRGDGWGMDHGDGVTRVMVVDGLGHGPSAYDAAQAALAVFRQHVALGPADILPLLHDALRSKRGAAMALMRLDSNERSVRFAGIGNLSAMIFSRGTQRNLMSHNGTVGHEMRRVQEMAEPWDPDATYLVHTDGVRTRWKTDTYPGILARDPALLAGVVFRDNRRERDDSTVLAFRQAQSGAAA